MYMIKIIRRSNYYSSRKKIIYKNIQKEKKKYYIEVNQKIIRWYGKQYFTYWLIQIQFRKILKIE